MIGTSLSPGCRNCRNCRTTVGAVGRLSDYCRTVGCRTVGPLSDHCRTTVGPVGLLPDGDMIVHCRTLSDTVGLSDCRTVGLSDCRTVGLWDKGHPGPTLTAHHDLPRAPRRGGQPGWQLPQLGCQSGPPWQAFQASVIRWRQLQAPLWPPCAPPCVPSSRGSPYTVWNAWCASPRPPTVVDSGTKSCFSTAPCFTMIIAIWAAGETGHT